MLQKPEGNTLVMGCRYHGWSYDTTGKLIKAPQMDGVQGFDKAEYPLFAIHTHTTRHGHIFVNFEAEDKPSVAFDEWFKGLEGEMKEFPFEQYELYPSYHGESIDGSHSGYAMEGEFNWKTLMDGYQECYRTSLVFPN